MTCVWVISVQPSNATGNQPRLQPSNQPSNRPSNQPRSQPTNQPRNQPTNQPSNTEPSNHATKQPRVGTCLRVGLSACGVAVLWCAVACCGVVWCCVVAWCFVELCCGVVWRHGQRWIVCAVLTCEARPERIRCAGRRRAIRRLPLLVAALSKGVGCPPQAFLIDIRWLLSPLPFPYVIVNCVCACSCVRVGVLGNLTCQSLRPHMCIVTTLRLRQFMSRETGTENGSKKLAGPVPRHAFGKL